MSLSYWNKFDKRKEREDQKKYTEGGIKYVRCKSVRDHQPPYDESFDLLLNSLNKASHKMIPENL